MNTLTLFCESCEADHIYQMSIIRWGQIPHSTISKSTIWFIEVIRTVWVEVSLWLTPQSHWHDFFRWGTRRVPHLYRSLCHSVILFCPESYSTLQTSTEARLAPLVEYKQLSMCTVHWVYRIVQLGPNPVPHLLCKAAILLFYKILNRVGNGTVLCSKLSGFLYTNYIHCLNLKPLFLPVLWTKKHIFNIHLT